ncbi:rhamnan synthesis F family protein [Agrobacterium tumefaciens]|uniref:rhamnan synthesis F family protein n=1 Tax=Agrobacterium tumefaciens TaxID=358 RepID=UPI000558317E|nr:rhamnan synthesis F family protein [Agrobacterium tumefaciens]
MYQLKTLGLEPGYYDISVSRKSDLDAVEIADFNDVERCCRLDFRSGKTNYKVHLKKPLHNIVINTKNKIRDPEEIPVLFSQISKNSFEFRKIFLATQKHALQSFGPGEKLLCLESNACDREKAAFANVEYRYMHLYGLDDASRDRNGWHWLDDGWPIGGRRAIYTGKIRSCIYVHLHYIETWPELRAIILEDCFGRDIIIGLTSPNIELQIEILKTFPHATIVVTENRGRDVGPFMELLRQGRFDKYDTVCKIHGKLSRKDGKQTKSGTRIRRYIYASLLRDGAHNHILDLFDAIPELGVVGPKNLSLPKTDRSVTPYLKGELKQIGKISKRTGLSLEPDDIQFFVGTMFWFRPAAFHIVREANIGLRDFDLENGAKRGTLQHSLERMFSVFVRHAGYKIGTSQPAIQADGTPHAVEFI